jgi:DNA-binding beta-propeller fold protein YncE
MNSFGPFSTKQEIFRRKVETMYRFAVGCAVAFPLLTVSAIGATLAPLRLAQSIPLSGVEGRIDHFAVDVAGQRLFICALGNNSVEVVDLQKARHSSSITGLGAPEGSAYVPESNRLYVANESGGLCKIYDAASFALTGTLSLKDDADNVRYDGATHRIYVGFGKGGIGVIDATNGNRIGSIKLSAHPEAFVFEEQGRRIFVNLPTARAIAIIDRDKGEQIAAWKTDGAFANFPIALDEINHRLFVGCRLPAKMVVLNTDTGRVVTSIAIAGDIDDLFYDAKRQRLYAICGEGNVEIIEQLDSDKYKIAATIPTASGARTGLFVPQLNSLFVAVPHRGNQAAEVRRYSLE